MQQGSEAVLGGELLAPATVDTWVFVHEEPSFRLEQTAVEPDRPHWEWIAEQEGCISLDLHLLWECLCKQLGFDSEIFHAFELAAEVAEGEVVFKVRKAGPAK